MALENVRIIDLSRVISGPFCSQLLADLGADVIKIEPPEGDPLRKQGAMVGDASAYFANYNRGKRSLVLDLYLDEGRAVLERLLAEADVLLENFRPDVLARMGFCEARLRQINPKLIHCNINGFGVDGPLAERPAFDFVIQAMSGFMACNGNAGEAPMRSGVPIADLVSGLYAALAIAAAIADRDRTGFAKLSVSMLASMMSMLSFKATDYLNAGDEGERTGNDHGLVTPYGLYPTLDDPVTIAPSNEVVYRKLIDALELHELGDDPRFATNAQRRRQREEVNRILATRTRAETSAALVEKLNRAGVPCGPVYGIAEAFRSEQVTSQHIVEPTRLGEHELAVLGSPIRDHAGAWPAAPRPTPRLGEQADEILATAGYSAEEIERLRALGVLRTAG